MVCDIYGYTGRGRDGTDLVPTEVLSQGVSAGRALSPGKGMCASRVGRTYTRLSCGPS